MFMARLVGRARASVARFLSRRSARVWTRGPHQAVGRARDWPQGLRAGGREPPRPIAGLRGGTCDELAHRSAEVRAFVSYSAGGTRQRHDRIRPANPARSFTCRHPSSAVSGSRCMLERPIIGRANGFPPPLSVGTTRTTKTSRLPRLQRFRRPAFAALPTNGLASAAARRGRPATGFFQGPLTTNISPRSQP